MIVAVTLMIREERILRPNLYGPLKKTHIKNVRPNLYVPFDKKNAY